MSKPRTNSAKNMLQRAIEQGTAPFTPFKRSDATVRPSESIESRKARLRQTVIALETAANRRAEPPLMAYEGGATRTVKTERRELIPKTAMDALARRLALGAAKHGVNNWRKGGEEFRLATVNHLIDHIFEYLENGGSENTDAIICNAAFLCEYEARTPYEGYTE